jgi:hypothetical protein
VSWPPSLVRATMVSLKLVDAAKRETPRRAIRRACDMLYRDCQPVLGKQS